MAAKIRPFWVVEYWTYAEESPQWEPYKGFSDRGEAVALKEDLDLDDRSEGSKSRHRVVKYLPALRKPPRKLRKVIV